MLRIPLTGHNSNEEVLRIILGIIKRVKISRTHNEERKIGEFNTHNLMNLCEWMTKQKSQNKVVLSHGHPHTPTQTEISFSPLELCTNN